MSFLRARSKKCFSECLTNDETTLDGPPIGHRSVLGYDQSGHIPNANPNDPGVILWLEKHRLNTGRNGTLWSAPGFGPRTFDLCEVSWVPGKDSPIGWTLESDRGIELGTSREIDNSLCDVDRGAGRAGVLNYGMGVITRTIERAPVTQRSAPEVKLSRNTTRQRTVFRA